MALLTVSDVTEFDLAWAWYDEYREVYPKVDHSRAEDHFCRWMLTNHPVGCVKPLLLTEEA